MGASVGAPASSGTVRWRATVGDRVRHSELNSKVPEITALFWVTKLLTTGMGETTSDFVVTTIDPVIGVVVAFALLVAALLLLVMGLRAVFAVVA